MGGTSHANTIGKSSGWESFQQVKLPIPPTNIDPASSGGDSQGLCWGNGMSFYTSWFPLSQQPQWERCLATSHNTPVKRPRLADSAKLYSTIVATEPHESHVRDSEVVSIHLKSSRPSLEISQIFPLPWFRWKYVHVILSPRPAPFGTAPDCHVPEGTWAKADVRRTNS